MNKPLTPDNCGASQIACNVINNTFLSLDGFEAMRKQMAGTTYTAEQFGGELARIVDRELAAVESNACSYCGGSCPSDEEHACDGYLGDIDGIDSADASDELLASPPTVQY